MAKISSCQRHSRHLAAEEQLDFSHLLTEPKDSSTFDDMATDLKIQLFLTTPGVAYYYSAKLVDPVRVKIAIVKIEPVSGKANDDRDQQSMRNSDKLIDQQEKLFENMKYADETIKTGGREFLAHKAILASRSQVFDAMFQHSTKEKLSNQVEIEDIHPDVFGQLLRFIYTGRLSLTTMEAMAVGLYAAADKYFLDQLKAECEDHLIRQMSPENCIQLLLDADRQPPSEHLLANAIEYFRLHQSQVMATDTDCYRHQQIQRGKNIKS